MDESTKKIARIIDFILSSYSASASLIGGNMSFNEDGTVTLIQGSGRTTVFFYDERYDKVSFKEV